MVVNNLAPIKPLSILSLPQIHLIRALWLRPPLHPGCGPAAIRPGPWTLHADYSGCAPQHLAPLQDTAGVPASPSAAALQEHHHHLPQENQRRLHHRAELRLPPAIEALPVQRGAGGGWPQRATSVRVGVGDTWGRLFQLPLYCSSPVAGCHWPAVLSPYTCVARYPFLSALPKLRTGSICATMSQISERTRHGQRGRNIDSVHILCLICLYPCCQWMIYLSQEWIFH